MRNAFFFDIDGTLAIRRDVPESASASIAQLRSQGDYVFICTGRNPAYAQKNFGQYADGFICCNGRLAVRDSEILYAHPLDQDQIRDLIWEKIKDVNQTIPHYKRVTDLYITEEPFIKTTSLKIKRKEQIKKVLEL